jgi:hypothetical protein
MSDIVLFNFRMPGHLKRSFEKTCVIKNVSMTSQLNILIWEHINIDEKMRERFSKQHDDLMNFYMSHAGMYD